MIEKENQTDYGKLAYLKAEDLSRRVTEMEKQLQKPAVLPLSIVFDRSRYFSSFTDIQRINLLSARIGSMEINVKLVAEGTANCGSVVRVTPSVCSVAAATVELPFSISKQLYSFTFTLPLPRAGDNELDFRVEADGTNILHSFSVHITASGVAEKRKDSYISGFDTQYGTFFAAENGENMDFINQTLLVENLSSPSFSLSKRDKSAASALKYNASSYRLCYGYLQSGTLFLQEINLLTQAVLNTFEIARNVSDLSLYSGGGGSCCVLGYLQGGEVYAVLIGYNNGFVLSSPVKLPFSGKADKVNVLRSDGLPAVAARVGKSWYLKRHLSVESGQPVFDGKNIKLAEGESLFAETLSGETAVYIGLNGTVRKLNLDTEGVLTSSQIYDFCDGLVLQANYKLQRFNDRLKLRIIS